MNASTGNGKGEGQQVNRVGLWVGGWPVHSPPRDAPQCRPPSLHSTPHSPCRNVAAANYWWNPAAVARTTARLAAGPASWPPTSTPRDAVSGTPPGNRSDGWCFDGLAWITSALPATWLALFSDYAPILLCGRGFAVTNCGFAVTTCRFAKSSRFFNDRGRLR